MDMGSGRFLRRRYWLPLLVAGLWGEAQAQWIDESPQPDLYIGVGAGSSELGGGALTAVSMTNVNLRFGYHFNNYFSVEAHGGFGSDQSGVLFSSPSVKYGSLFVRFDLPFERTNVYLLAGGSYFQSSAVGGSTKSGNEGSPAYGAGIELFGNRDTAVTLEWGRYLANADSEVYDVVGLGFVTHFEWPALR